ncbi:hypothetical protein [Paenibacillus sp. 1A_MP2]|uniref:hypothetical protein n=1 Tax=Paenibacillus sp. 1A_MP2 TaxID=3457495 RepID=UPI003FCE93A8
MARDRCERCVCGIQVAAAEGSGSSSRLARDRCDRRAGDVLVAAAEGSGREQQPVGQRSMRSACR